MQAGGVALHWRGGGIRSSTVLRAAVFAGAIALTAATVATGTMMVPVRAAVLPPDERSRYLLLGVAAALFVAAAVGAFLLGMRRWSGRLWSSPPVQAALESRHTQRLLAPLAVLRPELVPARLIVMTAVLALAMDVAAWLLGMPLWVVASAAVVPWLPLFFAEGLRKYKHYGLYAVFGAITLLQIGHLTEHTVQVVQVFMFNGELSRAHGVFGQLDFETVHFVWDSIVWIGLGVLLLRFGGTNKWLWLSFAASSLHEIEHIYLFVIYRFDPGFYAAGGLEGIMGSGGLIGSMLARPYLHFTYNVLVIVPLVIAFWDQTVRVYRQTPRTT